MKTANKVMAILAMLVLALSAVSTAQAATITWGGATTITADTDVLTTGSLKYAYHWVPNAVDATVNGVTFTGSTVLNGGTNVTVTAPHTGYVSGPLYAGRGLSAEFTSALSGVVYDYDADGHGTTQVTLNNLTPGTPYSVQVFVQLPGYGFANWAYTILDSTVALQWSDINQEDGLGKYSIGTFTADASTQTLSLEGWDGSEQHYIGSAPFNALQVRGPANGDLIIEKYNDLDGDGSLDGDPLIPGWTFGITYPDQTTGSVTDNEQGDMDEEEGIIRLTDLAPGDYTVSEIAPGWTCTYDTDGSPFGTVLATVEGGLTTTVQFGNTTGAGAVPEPASLALIGLALLAVRKRRS